MAGTVETLRLVIHTGEAFPGAPPIQADSCEQVLANVTALLRIQVQEVMPLAGLSTVFAPDESQCPEGQ